jgi:hypothetical protein
MRMTAIVLGIFSLLALCSVPNARGAGSANGATWRTFVNRAGWRISYPPHWQIGSCHQCSDPTDPDVFVTIFEPSTKTMIMIEHLIDKPVDEDVGPWLKEVSRDSVLNPQISEEWIVLDHRKALRVINGNPDSTSSENTYMLDGKKTFAIRASRNDPSYTTYRRILSTFKFVAHK